MTLGKPAQNLTCQTCSKHPNRKSVFEVQLWRPWLTNSAAWGVVVALGLFPLGK